MRKYNQSNIYQSRGLVMPKWGLCPAQAGASPCQRWVLALRHLLQKQGLLKPKKVLLLPKLGPHSAQV